MKKSVLTFVTHDTLLKERQLKRFAASIASNSLRKKLEDLSEPNESDLTIIDPTVDLSLEILKKLQIDTPLVTLLKFEGLQKNSSKEEIILYLFKHKINFSLLEQNFTSSPLIRTLLSMTLNKANYLFQDTFPWGGRLISYEKNQEFNKKNVLKNFSHVEESIVEDVENYFKFLSNIDQLEIGDVDKRTVYMDGNYMRLNIYFHTSHYDGLKYYELLKFYHSCSLKFQMIVHQVSPDLLEVSYLLPIYLEKDFANQGHMFIFMLNYES